MTSIARSIACDFEISVDVRDASGKGRRLKTLVTCDVPVVTDMQVVAKATKPNGWTCTWKGRAGAVMRPFPEIVRDRQGVESQAVSAVGDLDLRRQTQRLSENDLDCRRSDRHALTGEIFYDPSNREAIPWADKAA